MQKRHWTFFRALLPAGLSRSAVKVRFFKRSAKPFRPAGISFSIAFLAALALLCGCRQSAFLQPEAPPLQSQSTGVTVELPGFRVGAPPPVRLSRDGAEYTLMLAKGTVPWDFRLDADDRSVYVQTRQDVKSKAVFRHFVKLTLPLRGRPLSSVVRRDYFFTPRKVTGIDDPDKFDFLPGGVEKEGCRGDLLSLRVVAAEKQNPDIMTLYHATYDLLSGELTLIAPSPQMAETEILQSPDFTVIRYENGRWNRVAPALDE